MFPYMLGVVAAMQDDFGDALREVGAVGGASAGTFGALLLATGVSARALRAVCRKGGCFGGLAHTSSGDRAE